MDVGVIGCGVFELEGEGLSFIVVLGDFLWVG